MSNRFAATAIGAVALLLSFEYSAAIGAEIDPKVGEGIARANCAACHTLGPSRAVELPPTFFELAQNPATTEGSLQFLLTHPHYAMPNLRLDSGETAEIIAYITSLRQQGR